MSYYDALGMTKEPVSKFIGGDLKLWGRVHGTLKSYQRKQTQELISQPHKTLKRMA